MSGKIIRRFLRSLLGLAIVAVLLVGLIDRTPITEQRFFENMMYRLYATKLNDNGASQLKSGWTKVNITPDHSMPMAGYIPRDHFDTVHDSLYARILVLENDGFRAAMIDVDLLIFPPLLRDKIYAYTGTSTFLYLSATHTHNGVGGWDPSIGGRFITGSFDEDYVDDVARRISDAVKDLGTQNAWMQYWEVEAADLVENRIRPDSGMIDGKLRGIKLHRSDSSTAILFTSNAHATSLKSELLDISADYPAKTIELLEKENDFAMFMSGMVGSHRFKFTDYENYDYINYISPQLVDRIDTARYGVSVNAPHIRSAHVPIEFGPSQLRIAKNWKVNDWVFRLIFNELKGEITWLEFGDVAFVGTPCDFSGEIYVADSLEHYAAKHGKQLIITSFNGDYTGYITYDKHYDKSSKEEINALNWVGPGYGEYFSEMIKKLLEK